jgi:outer membrane lipoprotein SlyB
MNPITKALVAATALTLGACAMPYQDQTAQYPGGSAYPTYPNQYPSNPQYPNQSQYPANPTYQGAYSGYGYVDTVEVVPASGHQGIGIGAIGGAIAGGVLGNQVGHGTGRAAATVGGAVAGGVIGNEIEKRTTSPAQPASFRYRVRMDDGSYQSYAQDFDAGVRAGDRVRIDAGRVNRL